MIAPIPDNEAARLAELESFSLLDTLPEETYDAITFIASQICEVPIALISIVDRDRQWFKSRVGLDATETPRDVAFCAHAILEPESVMIVPDATADDRFATNPLVTEDPSIRFYAGAPLVTKSGMALGTLCVIDRIPRTLRPSQIQALEALSVQVAALLELRWTVDELKRNQQRLEEVMQHRETFIATVSHEIRTPLSAVVGYIDLLADPKGQISDKERGEMLATVGRQATDVSHLIEDLLIAARAESGSLQVTCVDVNVAAQTAQVLEGLDPDRVAAIRVETEACRASGDPGRVRQVIRNLVTNAFRYGGPDIAITARQIDDRCVLEVSDDGPGIPSSEYERIFEPFQQSSSGKIVSDSMGLGLPVSRLLTEKMGGTLTYERRGNRSVFCFDLPAAGSVVGSLEATGVAAG